MVTVVVVLAVKANTEVVVVSVITFAMAVEVLLAMLTVWYSYFYVRLGGSRSKGTALRVQ